MPAQLSESLTISESPKPLTLVTILFLIPSDPAIFRAISSSPPAVQFHQVRPRPCVLVSTLLQSCPQHLDLHPFFFIWIPFVFQSSEEVKSSSLQYPHQLLAGLSLSAELINCCCCFLISALYLPTRAVQHHAPCDSLPLHTCSCTTLSLHGEDLELSKYNNQTLDSVDQ